MRPHAPFEGHARILAADEETRGERALARRYGLGRELFERSVDIVRVDRQNKPTRQSGPQGAFIHLE